jgi:hypothetical protein
VAASLGLTHIVKERLAGVPDQNVSEVALPDVTDQTFIRQLMLGVQEAVIPNPVVQSLHEQYPTYLVSTPRYAGDRNIYSAGGKLFITNVKNHLRLNAIKFTKQAFYSLQKAELRSKDECAVLWMQTVGQPCTDVSECVFPQRREDIERVSLYREVLGLGDGEVINKAWLKSSGCIPKLLRYFVLLNRHIELLGPYTKRFNILPVCQVRAHFITIDKEVLFGIQQELKLVNCNMATFKSLSADHWKTVLRYDRYQTGHRTFTETVDTDGTSVCLHYTRPKTSIDRGSTDELVIRDDDRVLGVDPGRRTLLYIVEVLPSGEKRKYELTREQYYKESGIIHARRHSEKWNEEVKGALTALSQVSSKGANFDTFLTFVAVHVQHLTKLWVAYLRPHWAQQRLRLYGGKKRVFALFFNKVAAGAQPGQRTIVAFGSAKFEAGGKGEVSVPTTRAYKECCYRFITKATSEHLTTKKHYGTGDLLQLVRRKSDGKIIRGLLWCDSTYERKFINRDENAALNIRMCLMMPDRPDALKFGQPKCRQKVGKIIKR